MQDTKGLFQLDCLKMVLNIENTIWDWQRSVLIVVLIPL